MERHAAADSLRLRKGESGRGCEPVQCGWGEARTCLRRANGSCGCVCHATHKAISLRLTLPLTSSALEMITRRGSSGERREGMQAETRRLRAHKRDRECPQLRSNTNLECTMLIISHALQPRRNSLTNSYVKNDVAMLGATFTVHSQSVPSFPQ